MSWLGAQFGEKVGGIVEDPDDGRPVRWEIAAVGLAGGAEEIVDENVGVGVGLADGNDVGAAVGFAVGNGVGTAVGCAVGTDVGAAVGCADGTDVGGPVGSAVGSDVGAAVGK